MAGMKTKASPAADKGILIYHTLRNKLLTLDPQEVNITATPEYPHVWGVMMETLFPEVIVTLVALVDGTTSLYFSTGNGILGSGNHTEVGSAARRMLTVAEMAIEFTQPVKEYPHPRAGNIRLYLLTFEGIQSAECPEAALQSGDHPLSGLYFAGQQLLSQIRLIKAEQKKD